MGQEQTDTAQLVIVLDPTETKLPIDRLEALLADTPVACLILSTPAPGAIQNTNVQALVSMAQHQGIAVLISNDENMAKELSADGVHLSPNEEPITERYARSREMLGTDLIVGVEVGTSRHDAMALAEAGADYVAFGVPSESLSQERARERQRELVAWWAEVFQPPCVALDIMDHEQAGEFAELGADFVARALPNGLADTELKQWLSDAQNALTPSVHCD